MFNDVVIAELKNRVRSLMSERRYKHTIGVAGMAYVLGTFLLPAKKRELYIAGLLHDITKEMDFDKQIELINEGGYSLTDEDLNCKAALHSLSGAELVKLNFKEFATTEIVSAIECHTLGNSDMSLFSKIIFIADFIEFGREYPSSIETRKTLFRELNDANNENERVKALNRAVYMSLNLTSRHLNSINKLVHSRSIEAKNAILPLI